LHFKLKPADAERRAVSRARSGEVKYVNRGAGWRNGDGSHAIR